MRVTVPNITVATGAVVLVLAGLTAASARAQAGSSGPVEYVWEGRRDPFVPTIGSGIPSDKCSDFTGMRAVLVQEVKLTGIMQTPSGAWAQFVGGPDNQPYYGRVGDQFCDGVLHEINSQNWSITIRQERQEQGKRLMRPWNDVVRHLYPEADDGGGSSSVGVGGNLGGSASSGRGPGLHARPDTSKNRQGLSWRQGR